MNERHTLQAAGADAGSTPTPMAPGDEAPASTPGTGEDICPACSGKGSSADGTSCPVCQGTGKVISGIGGA